MQQATLVSCPQHISSPPAPFLHSFPPQVNFEQDVIISQMNEYEVLQLLMGDCREGLAAYKTSMEDDTKLLQQRDLSARERLAARLRLAEKTILSQVCRCRRVCEGAVGVCGDEESSFW